MPEGRENLANETYNLASHLGHAAHSTRASGDTLKAAMAWTKLTSRSRYLLPFACFDRLRVLQNYEKGL